MPPAAVPQKHRRPLLGFLLTLCAAAWPLAPGAARADATADKVAIVRRAAEEVLRPAYRDLAVRAGEMEAAETALCAAPSDAALLAARERFAALVTAFSRVEFVRFGPIMEDNRIERFLFWPDRRGVALRQVQALLAAKDESTATPEGLRAKSVAVQGLNALEFVLFGGEADVLKTTDGSYRCRFGAAVAGGLVASSQAISEGWERPDGIVKALTEPNPDSPAYREIDDALDELIATFVHGLEAIRDLRIQPGLGKTAAEANPKAWLYQRSGLTETSLQANFAGLSELYDRSRIADLLPPASREVDGAVTDGFGEAGRAFQALARPIATATADPAGRERVGALLATAQTLQHLFADRFAPAVGLQAGFSSLDGD